jgi:hypothetical protein
MFLGVVANGVNRGTFREKPEEDRGGCLSRGPEEERCVGHEGHVVAACQAVDENGVQGTILVGGAAVETSILLN